MIIGVGIDIIKIAKMKSAIERLGDAFLDRIFNKEEIKHIEKGKIYYQRLAARFAAKEAVIKAVSKEYPFTLKDIIILNRENGAPYCKFKKDFKIDILLSITHIEEYAVACAVAQKSEVRGQRAKVRSQRTEDKIVKKPHASAWGMDTTGGSL
ncbi:MAG: holo-ACP synthase [Candidatus Omnitrophota bacterium]